MSSSGLKLFDTTLHKTSVWWDDVMKEMAREGRHKAYSTLRAVLHAVRGRRIPDEAVNLGAQLPTLIRGFYYENWRLAGKPLKYRHREDFLRQVKNELPGLDGPDLERAVSAVFKVVSSQVPGGVIVQVRDQSPAEVREFWH